MKEIRSITATFNDKTIHVAAHLDTQRKLLKVELQAPAADAAFRRHLTDFADMINLSLEQGITIDQHAAGFNFGPRLHPVVGHPRVKSADSHIDMIFQLLSDAEKNTQAPAPRVVPLRKSTVARPALTLIPGGRLA